MTNLEWFRVPEKIYFKKGCLPVALRELKDVYHKTKAAIIADETAFRDNITKSVTDLLNELQIVYADICISKSDDSIIKGAETARKIKPDCIIAIGNAGVEAGKLIRVLYENEGLTLDDLKKRTNLRDREISTLKTSADAYFIAVAASDCSGAEVDPFAMGAEDYALLPDMAIIDTDMIQMQDIRAVNTLSLSALRSSVRAFASPFTSDYAQGLAVRAIQLIFAYLPVYQANPADMYALERLSNAVIMASMGDANVYTEDALTENGFAAAAEASGLTEIALREKVKELKEAY